MVKQIGSKTGALRAWLEANEGKKPAGPVDVSTVLVADDALSEQSLATQAEDLAIEGRRALLLRWIKLA